MSARRRKKSGEGSEEITEFPYAYLMTECLLMGISEADFWESTPRKIIALIDQKKEIEKAKVKNQAVYIACMVWGKDPDEMIEKEGGPVPGRDIPIDPNALKVLF